MKDNPLSSLVFKAKYLVLFQVLLPGEVIVLKEMAESTKAIIKEAKRKPGSLFGILPTNPHTTRFIETGTFFSVQQIGEDYAILLAGSRFNIEKFVKNGELLIKPITDQGMNLQEVFAGYNGLEEMFKQSMNILKEKRNILLPLEKLEKFTAGELADYLARFLSKDSFFPRADLLNTFDEAMRLDKAIMYLNSFVADVPKKVSKKSTSPRKVSSEVKEFQKRFDDIKESLDNEIRNEIQKELKKLARTPASSGNYDYFCRWMDFVLSFYSLRSAEDNQDVNSVWDILDGSHYGLLEVKERVHEELIVRRLNPKKKGPILCFVGPPGTGKTSMGGAIAESLGRDFVRISLGGVRDEAEIRGHKLTYVGALPGNITRYILKSKSSNPLFMIDEIDKVGKYAFKGDIESALLEVLDPEQNHAFADHYVGMPADISKVMFICTANTWEGILPALQDRMERIIFRGYTVKEKLNIAKKFLIKKQAIENGLFSKELDIKKLRFSDKALRFIIESYTDEKGVRNLEREIGCILRKLAKEVFMGRAGGNIIINTPDVRNFLGSPKKQSGTFGFLTAVDHQADSSIMRQT